MESCFESQLKSICKIILCFGQRTFIEVAVNAYTDIYENFAHM